ncbi:MAG TPA: MBL fold metallo-hydrolase [Methylomirabilota bacterium]|jgi:L-ascorbate metabolism protein UlaG (beta-lactamase superfamily)|nr:MBL fold metallo-hydrolase [Methylomirabilota bacterium]
MLLLAAGCAGVGAPVPGAPPHHRQHGFANTDPAFARPGFWTVQAFRARRIWAALGGRRDVPSFPHAANDGRALRDNATMPTVTWVGHATLLIQLDGLNVLTDPHFSERASPVGFAGPRRLNPPGLAFEALPRIDVVVISHDHYDHLDRASVQRLAATHKPRFLAPLGFKAWFASVGIEGVEELDWWQSRQIGGVTFTLTPVQHWCARTPFDMDRRLWGGWAMAGRERRAYFAGDTGYFDGFGEIRRRLGPFDLAMVSISAYEPPAIMGLTHTTPEQSLRVFADLGARTFVAMHWGTFDLSDEPLEEPPRRLRAAARAMSLPDERVWILAHGETRKF